MLVKFKIAVLRLISAWRCLWLRRRGFHFGRGCFVDGKPYTRTTRGSRVELGDDVTLISNRRHNPLLSHPMNIRTLSPEARIRLADHVGVSGCSLVCCNSISVGEYTIIGPDTLVYDSEGHNYFPETGWRIRTVRSGRPITIGKKCFIGARCMILSGVTIGDNCVVAAGTVVTQDIPTGHRASGNPATCTPLPKILGGPGRKKIQPGNSGLTGA